MELKEYQECLTGKIKVANKRGISINVDDLHSSSKPHQKAIIDWLLKLGAALIGADAGLGKTHMGIESMRMLHQEFGGKYLVVTELGAADTWIDTDPEVGEGARLGVPMEYVTNTQQAMDSACWLVVTNYERVRIGDIDFGAFKGVWLDEGNYLKNMASETTDQLQKELKKVQFKYVATATPAPNEILELINYAHVLGICDRGQILTRFFQRNSTKAGELTLHPQHKKDFYLWVYSWAVFITTPSDLGFDDEGYKLPKLICNFQLVPMNKAIEGGVDREGQKRLYADSTNNLPEASRVKRDSISARVAYAVDLLLEKENVENIADLKEHCIIWHHLELERLALKEVFKDHPGYREIFGKQDVDIRERNVVGFTKGEFPFLGTKPDLNGVGCNFQKFCHHAIALGVTHSWDEFYQAFIKRLLRFGQIHDVTLDVLYIREEADIIDNIKRKWKEHDEQRNELRAIMQEFGLEHDIMIEQRKRSFMLNRKVYEGQNWTLINNDAVYEWAALPANSIDLIKTSVPFGNHYEYTDKYNDFGHNEDLKAYLRQMDHLIPSWYNALKPGRIACIDLKNRIHYGSVTGKGFSIFHRFSHAFCEAMEKHGFECMGFHYIPTDVVAENNQTYRLTFGEMQKDSTKMGAGIPEEIWIFRKPPTYTDNAYADVPVTHNCECPLCKKRDVYNSFIRPGAILLSCPDCKQYFHEADLIRHSDSEISLPQWQIDADSFWRSSGNRMLTPDELATMDLKKIRKWWNGFNENNVYDYEAHVAFLTTLLKSNKLSKTFTTVPLRSNSPYIWNDVNRMHGLNLEQSRRKQQNHICPEPFDKVDRCIELYSNEDETVGDPFSGLGTTGVRALKKKRRAFLTELNETYSGCSAVYLRETEKKRYVPTLFDLLTTAA